MRDHQGCPSKRLLGIPAISINLHAATQLVYLLLGHQCAVCPPIPALPTPLAFALGLGLGLCAGLATACASRWITGRWQVRIARIAPQLLAEHLDLLGQRLDLFGQLRHQLLQLLDPRVPFRKLSVLSSQLGFQLGNSFLGVQLPR